MAAPLWSPAPWRACKNGDCSCGQVWSIPADAPIAQATVGDWGDEVAVIGADGPKIDMMVYGSIPEAMGKANARLIAAAPELYAGLTELLDAIEPELIAFASSRAGRDDDDFREEFPIDYERCKRLRALLSKARGEG